MGRAVELHQLGQSIWYDNIERGMLEDGSIAKMIEAREIYGITSNPSIFEKAIGSGSAYDFSIRTLAISGMDKEQIYARLSIEDIQSACDLFSTLYDESAGNDGFVSLEVNPLLARDTEKTISDGRSLWAQVNRKNLMIKVPATKEGLPAIRALIAEGIHVNATLLFSVERYREVMEAFLAGLEDRLAMGEEVAKIRSVASFFISRIDSAADKAIEGLLPSSKNELKSLLGKTAIANAKMAYQAWKETLKSKRYLKLKAFGAVMQYPLWASTGTKNPAYSDTLYVDALVARGSVNTVPPQTLKAFLDHGSIMEAIENGVEEAKETLEALASLGIDLSKITSDLEDDGIEKFKEAFLSLLDTIEKKREKVIADLGSLGSPVENAIIDAAKEVMVRRLFEHDPTLWTEDRSQFDEIRNRLGWLSLPEAQLAVVKELESFRNTCLNAGFKDVFVLGMGGSSLAPEVFSLTFAKEIPSGQGLKLKIIDTTNPDEIAWREASVNLRTSLFIVASKSGSTSETNAAFHYFWQRLKEIGVEHPGDHFIAITDPGTSLERLAKEHKFMRTFAAPANVGGRYSAFTSFGVVPAALMGIDLQRMLSKAVEAQHSCAQSQPYPQNPGLVLGLTLAEACKKGLNKLSFTADEACKPFGPWLEQLIAESSGKDGKGMLPIEGEPVLSPDAYSNDRIFIDMRIGNDESGYLEGLRKAGHPLVRIRLTEIYDLAKEFYLWEYATAILCAGIGVNPFDQPNVQESKTNTKAVIAQYKENGKLDEGEPIWQGNEASLFSKENLGAISQKSLPEVMGAFLHSVSEGGFIAINAYLERTPDTEKRLASLRKELLERYHVPVTLGFGPRFQHSTGQLHKGGFAGGYFLVLTKSPEKDLPIPEEGMRFGTLQLAQALGDISALERNGKKVMRVHLKSSTPEALL
ncbi:MAG: bifunctional transaldolase/phosoglucose isomerase [Anaerolineaceae bacterium]|nr:bifunctional transaldolase/phosoglucose isomerase [Anaerolineaceae bacterium]